MLAGLMAANLAPGHSRRTDVITLAHQMFNGWKQMCESTVSNSCQDTHLCGPNADQECLPSWKFDDAITAELGTNQIVGTDPQRIIDSYRQAVSGSWREPAIPPLWDGCAADRIVKIMLIES